MKYRLESHPLFAFYTSNLHSVTVHIDVQTKAATAVCCKIKLRIIHDDDHNDIHVVAYRLNCHSNNNQLYIVQLRFIIQRSGTWNTWVLLTLLCFSCELTHSPQ